MGTTTIVQDQPFTKTGIREGWSIDVHAGPDARVDTILNVAITSPNGERFVLRHGLIAASQAEEAVRKGWTMAITEVDMRRAEGTR